MLNVKLFNYVVIYLTMDGRALFVKKVQYSVVGNEYVKAFKVIFFS